MTRPLSMAAALFLVAACGAELAPSPANTATGADSADAQPAVDAASAADTGADAPAPTDASVKNHAKVFAFDPVTDKGQTTLVPLRAPTDPDGKLKGEFVEVRNCLQEDGGEPISRGGFPIGALCHEVATVTAGADGSYLHVAPPADHAEVGDPFAELMMYYHVNQIHDYFADQFGLHGLDYPVYALVNVTLKALGAWQGFPNAAFMPKEAFAQFNLKPRDKGAIVFGQYKDTDFSYDASVIYHEYTHAMIGTTRLLGVLIDFNGLDNLPGAMNEGFADYFAASLRDSPVIGPYALTFGGDHLKRDLSLPRRCPDDLTTEIHADGKIVGSALWSIRKELGRDATDGIVLAALQQFSQQTNLGIAAKLIHNEAKKVDADTAAKVKAALQAHGLLSCDRARPLTTFDAGSSADKVPFAVEGKQEVGAMGPKFQDGVPGYIQFAVDVPPSAKAIQIRWRAEAQAGFGGFGGKAPELSLAIAKGKTVSLDLLNGGAVIADAKVAAVADPKVKDGRIATLTGKCINPGGKLYVMTLNTGGKGAIVAISAEPVDPAGAPGVADCTK